MNVKTILARKGYDVITIAPDRTVAEAVRQFELCNVGALVVSDDGYTLAGILSERDVIRGLATTGPAILSATVEALMSRDVFVCTRRDSVDALFAMMTDRRVRHLPVVEHGIVVGIVSIGDVVKYRVDSLAEEADALRDYILHA